MQRWPDGRLQELGRGARWARPCICVLPSEGASTYAIPACPALAKRGAVVVQRACCSLPPVLIVHAVPRPGDFPCSGVVYKARFRGETV